jgi:hypothetical protein
MGSTDMRFLPEDSPNCVSTRSRTVRGGSFLCNNWCWSRHPTPARSSNTTDSNIRFRMARIDVMQRSA